MRHHLCCFLRVVIAVARIATAAVENTACPKEEEAEEGRAGTLDIEIDNNADAMAADKLVSDDPNMRRDRTDKEDTQEEDAKDKHLVNDAEDKVEENDEAVDKHDVNVNYS